MTIWTALLIAFVFVFACAVSMQYGISLANKYHDNERIRVTTGYYHMYDMSSERRVSPNHNQLPDSFEDVMRTNGQASCRLR